MDRKTLIKELTKILEAEEYEVTSYLDIQKICRGIRKKSKATLQDVASDVKGITDPAHLSKFELGQTGLAHETLFDLLNYYGYQLKIVKK